MSSTSLTFFRPRLFDEESPAPDDSAGLSVSGLWTMEDGFHGQLVDMQRAASTIREYRTYLLRWQAFWRAGGTPHWTGKQRAMDCTSIAHALPEPPAKQLTGADLKAFRAFLKETVAGGDRSRNKHIGLVVSVLRFASDEGLLGDGSPPRARNVQVASAAAKLYLTSDQADALYEACRVATWPRFDRRKRRLVRGPIEQWRAAVALFLNYGFRTQELICFQPEHEPLRWNQVSWHEDTPDPSGHCVCQFGWLWYVPQKQSRFKPDPLYLPLNEITAAHLRSVRPAEVAPDDPVFPWPRAGKRFYEQWNAILGAAKIKPKVAPNAEEQDYVPKHLRKTCATWHDNNVPGSASLILGHAKRGESGVTSAHYVNGEATVLRAVLSLPQPSKLRQVFGLKEPTDPQRLLF